MHAWKPPSFDELSQPFAANRVAAPLPVEVAEPVAVVAPAPNLQDLQAIRAKAHQEGFVRGLQEGLTEGRAQGEALGRDEGLRLGREQGHALGLEQGLQEGRDRIAQLTASMQQLIGEFSQLPASLEPALLDWVYQTAKHLAGQDGMAREPFANAVQEALLRLPRPGETLFLRIPSQEHALWQNLTQDMSAGLAVTLLEDPQLAAGHAYLEVAGARVDVGAAARDALVRSALGLLPVSTEQNT